MQKLTITVGTDGAVTVGAECIKGKKCKDVTRAIESALGKTVSDQTTTEYFEREEQHVENRHR